MFVGMNDVIRFFLSSFSEYVSTGNYTNLGRVLILVFGSTVLEPSLPESKVEVEIGVGGAAGHFP